MFKHVQKDQQKWEWTRCSQKMKDVRYRVQQCGLLLCDNEEEFRHVKNKLTNANLRFDSAVFIALRRGNFYNVFEFYNTRRGGEGGVSGGGKTLFYNSLNFSNGKFTTDGISTYDARKNLSTLHFKVAFVVTNKNISNPLRYLQDVRTKQYDTSSKVNFGIFGQMVDIHKYRWSIITTPAWFGSKHHDVEIGLANVLTQNLADISGSSGLMTPGRVEAFDFGVGTYLFRTSFMFRNPSSYAGDLQKISILKPFARDTWFCVATAILTLCFTLKLVLRLEDYLLRRNSNRLSWCTIIIFVVSAFCQQGISLKNNSVSSRVLVLSVLLLTYILYNYYTSSIVSSVINSKQITFQSVEELIQSNLDIGIERIAYLRVLNATSNPTLLHLNERATSTNDSSVTFLHQSKGIEEVRRGSLAYVAEAVTAYDSIDKSFTNDEICDLVELNAARPTLIYIVGKKNGQYNKIFSVSYRRIVQYGLLQRQQKIFLNEKPRCLNSVQFVQIGINQMATTLILLAVGYGLTFIILLLEVVFFKIQNA